MFRARLISAFRPVALRPATTFTTTTTTAAASLLTSVRLQATTGKPAAADAAGTVTINADGKRVIRKKKIIRRVVKKGSGAAAADGGAAAATAPVKTGDNLRHELRGTAASAAATRPQKTTLVKGYRIDEVTSLCSSSDAIFARRLPSGGCQFFAWPGTPLEVASAAIVSMPDTIRTVHAVFGRFKTPVDLVMDVDCQVPPEHWSMSKIRPFQKKLLDDTLSVVNEEIEKLGETIESQVVLQSPNLKKASFHIHTKLKDAAFADYNSLHGFLAKFHDRTPSVDLQIYRANGMLRMFSCMKENHTSAMAVFEDANWNIGFKDGKVPDEVAALHSVVVRPEGTYKRLLTFDAPRGGYQGHPGFASPASAGTGGKPATDGDAPAFKPVIVLLPRTEKEAVASASKWLRSATEAEVGEWRTWIGLGLCAFRVAHHFRDAVTAEGRPAMEEMLDAWIEASRHCPQKFKHGDCEARWATFDISKMQGNSDWWSAYQRLGRLEISAQAAIAAKEEFEKQQELNFKNRTIANRGGAGARPTAKK